MCVFFFQDACRFIRYHFGPELLEINTRLECKWLKKEGRICRVKGCKRLWLLSHSESQRFWTYILQSYCVFINGCKLHYVNYPGVTLHFNPHPLLKEPWWHPVSLLSWTESVAEDRNNFGVCERALWSAPIQDDRAALLQVRLITSMTWHRDTSWYDLWLLEYLEAQPCIFRYIASSLNIIR